MSTRLPSTVRTQLILLSLIILIAVIASVLNHITPPPLPAAASYSPNLFLGNPSSATPDPANRTNYLMVKPYFTLSYNDSTGTPNWVSWRVTSDDLGDAPRKQLFDPDNTLPPSFTRITHKDYTSTGFDRGHLCPHSDRAANQDMSFSTFVMTNIIPQAPNLNRKAWANLEEYARSLVLHDHDRLYILAGPYGQGGTGSDGPAQTLTPKAHGSPSVGSRAPQITVPSHCWKIILILPGANPPESDLSAITPDTRVIAVLMPNDNTLVGEDWTPFRTTPAEIERVTHLHFFTTLPPNLASALREKTDTTPIHTRK